MQHRTSNRRPDRRSVKIDEVMEFSRELSSFLAAGIPMMEALSTVSAQIGSPVMASVVDEMLDRIERGGSFTDAINAHPKVFPAYYRAIVHSADFTGRLDKVLEQLTSYLERDILARRQLRSALTYPVVVLVVASLAIAAMTMFVLPKFATLYRSLGAHLPLPTKMLLTFTDFITQFWWAVLLGIGACIGLAMLAFRGEAGKRRRDVVQLRVPVVGGLTRLVAVERFTRVLAALTEAGVPLPNGIRVASDATNNTVFQDHLSEVRDALLRGAGLSQPMEDTGMFPLPALQMIRVGERTGTLGVQLGKAATYYEREVTFRLKKATELFQPVIIFGVGLVVGFVAIAQIAAMYSVFSQVK